MISLNQKMHSDSSDELITIAVILLKNKNVLVGCWHEQPRATQFTKLEIKISSRVTKTLLTSSLLTWLQVKKEASFFTWSRVKSGPSQKRGLFFDFDQP